MARLFLTVFGNLFMILLFFGVLMVTTSLGLDMTNKPDSFLVAVGFVTTFVSVFGCFGAIGFFFSRVYRAFVRFDETTREDA